MPCSRGHLHDGGGCVAGHHADHQRLHRLQAPRGSGKGTQHSNTPRTLSSSLPAPLRSQLDAVMHVFRLHVMERVRVLHVCILTSWFAVLEGRGRRHCGSWQGCGPSVPCRVRLPLDSLNRSFRDCKQQIKGTVVKDPFERDAELCASACGGAGTHDACMYMSRDHFP